VTKPKLSVTSVDGYKVHMSNFANHRSVKAEDCVAATACKLNTGMNFWTNPYTISATVVIANSSITLVPTLSYLL